MGHRRVVHGPPRAAKFAFTVAHDHEDYYRVGFTGSGNYYLLPMSVAIYLIPRVYLSTPDRPSAPTLSRLRQPPRIEAAARHGHSYR